MKKVFYAFALAALAFAVVGFKPALAQTKPLSIAVVDVKMLMTKSDAANSIEDQLKKKRDAFAGELNTKEKGLRENEKALADQKATLPKEEFAKKVKDFESKLVDARREVQSKKQALDEATGKAYEQLREHIYNVVQQIATEKGYQLVISRDEVVLGDNSLDVSQLALERLNKDISKIDLVVSAAPAPKKAK